MIETNGVIWHTIKIFKFLITIFGKTKTHFG
jgi:hypothetical protein